MTQELDRLKESTRSKEIEAAMETAENSRRDASVYEQLGFRVLAKAMTENARHAEKWAARR